MNTFLKMKTETEYSDIRNQYTMLLSEWQQKESKLLQKFHIKEKQLIRLDAQRKNHTKNYPHWIKYLLLPVVEKMKSAFPDWHCEDEELKPMGIGSRVSIFFCKKTDQEPYKRYAASNSVYICFRPGNLQNGELYYQTGETIQEYKIGTIGQINGLNNVIKPVESIEELIKFLNDQILENGTQ